MRSEVRAADCCRIQEGGLDAENAYRLGFANGRESAIGQEGFELGSCKRDMGSAVAQVGTNRNCSRYSTHRVGSTSPTLGPTCSLR
jgi:hypothetical protein